MTTKIIVNISRLTGMGVLADRSAKDPSLDFRRFNLLYGFNGSGKTTLGRIFASIQAGARELLLPEQGEFEIKCSDGSTYTSSQLQSEVRELAVFNTDYVERNLVWSSALAKPIFYIGQHQVELVRRLEQLELELPRAETDWRTEVAKKEGAERSFATFRKERAKRVAEALAGSGRKYEALQLDRDHRERGERANRCTEADLEAHRQTCRMDTSPPTVERLADGFGELSEELARARLLIERKPSSVVLSELARHPSMLLWLKTGYEHHVANQLDDCLLCGNPLTGDRTALIAKVVDDQLQRLLGEVAQATRSLAALGKVVADLAQAMPDERALFSGGREEYVAMRGRAREALGELTALLEAATDAMRSKAENPASNAPAIDFPSETTVRAALDTVRAALASVNAVVARHNSYVASFAQQRLDAEIAIRDHYVADAAGEYAESRRKVEDSASAERAAADAVSGLRGEIAEIRAKIRTHGPAADTINALLRSYLGHEELQVRAVDDGYSICRHGAPLSGQPSEGEKTAIAVCYFLSNVESEGRKVKNMIVVMDDPVSSLDSKALNFACALIRQRLGEARQLFVLTHNLACMNEFKKAWKNIHAPPDKEKEPTAQLLYVEATKPREKQTRSSRVVPMPPVLREHDSEYHFLMSRVFKYRDGQDEFYYVMPNMIRRVLDVFLAFRCPGNSGLSQKIVQVSAQHSRLDRTKLVALERLANVESHSDNLDDLLSLSPMTIEETRDAAEGLLTMMETVDPEHFKAIRKQCGSGLQS